MIFTDPTQLPHIPQRVVSLVPSLTESMFALGLGRVLVGITDYCIHPAEKVTGLSRVGGTKNPRLADIIALQPELVIANREENPPSIVAALEEAGIAVWVTFPQTVDDALEILRTLAGLFRSNPVNLAVDTLERHAEWAQAAAQTMTQTRPPLRYFCPIWQDKTDQGQIWWMTFNQNTYTHDLLNILGGENCFAGRERRYPLDADLGDGKPEPAGERDTRYPRITLPEIQSAAPDLIILPDEPFAFDHTHHQQILALLAHTPAVQNERVYLVDGTLLFWYGTRLAHALQALPELFAAR